MCWQENTSSEPGEIDHIVRWDDQAEAMLRAAVRENDGLVRRILARGEDLEDVLQYLRFHLWKRHSIYDRKYRVTTFLFRYVRYLLLERIRELDRNPRVVSQHTLPLYYYCPNEEGEVPVEVWDPSAPVPEDELIRNDMVQHIRAALARHYPAQEIDRFLRYILYGERLPQWSALRVHRFRQIAKQAILEYSRQVESV